MRQVEVTTGVVPVAAGTPATMVGQAVRVMVAGDKACRAFRWAAAARRTARPFGPRRSVPAVGVAMRMAVKEAEAVEPCI